MICVKDILNTLDDEYSFHIQEKWDNSGFQFGNLSDQVKSILVTMDVGINSIEKAIKNNVNLIISHHPLFFEKISKLESEDGTYKKLKLLFENNINVISVHTPLDLNYNGVSKALSEACMLEEESFLIENNLDNGYGFFGNIKRQRFKDYAKELRKIEYFKTMVYYGDEDDIISKVGVMGGSGAFSIKYAIEKNLDLLITADLKYHDIQYAIENGLKLIDLGHFESEVLGLNKLVDFLKNKYDFKILMDDFNLFKRKLL